MLMYPVTSATQTHLSSLVSWLVPYLEVPVAILSEGLTAAKEDFCEHLRLCEFSNPNKSLGRINVFPLVTCLVTYQNHQVQRIKSLFRRMADYKISIFFFSFLNLFLNLKLWAKNCRSTC